LDDFFFGDSRVFLGDFGELVFGDLAFFGDSRVFLGDFGLVETLATFAFLGEVASFFGLEGALLVEDTFLVEVFLDPPFFDGDFVPVPAFFEVEVDLFFVVLTVDEEEVEVVPEVDGAVVTFLLDFFFFFLSLPVCPGFSL